MAFKTTPRITSWSPSKLMGYEQCPASTKYKYIDKIPDEPIDDPDHPLVRGQRIHGQAEQYVAGRTKKMGPDLDNAAAKVKRILNELRADYTKKRVRVEMELAFDRTWKACRWISKEVYVRFKVDVVHLLKPEPKAPSTADVIDWKTGRYKPEDPAYEDQLRSYSVAVLSSGLVEKVEPRLVFTDSGDIVKKPEANLHVKDLKKMQEYWDKRAKVMMNDTKFAPRPGNYCRYCPYSTNKGGPCRY